MRKRLDDGTHRLQRPLIVTQSSRQLGMWLTAASSVAPPAAVMESSLAACAAGDPMDSLLARCSDVPSMGRACPDLMNPIWRL